MQLSSQPGKTSPHASTQTLEEVAPSWNVIVLNDPVNLMSYVTMVFRKVFGYNKEKAIRHMMEVHENGRSLLWTGEREQAETYLHALHRWQLTAILERNG